MLANTTKNNAIFKTRMPSIRTKALTNLKSEFTCWCNNETSYFSFLRICFIRTQKLEDGNSKCGSFSGSSLSTTKKIISLKNDRYRLCLYRSWRCVSLFLKSLENRINNIERWKEHENTKSVIKWELTGSRNF